MKVDRERARMAIRTARKLNRMLQGTMALEGAALDRIAMRAMRRNTIKDLLGMNLKHFVIELADTPELTDEIFGRLDAIPIADLGVGNRYGSVCVEFHRESLLEASEVISRVKEAGFAIGLVTIEEEEEAPPPLLVGGFRISGRGTNSLPARTALIMATIDDLVADLLDDDREDDEELPPGAIEEAVASGEITAGQMVEMFASCLEGWLDG